MSFIDVQNAFMAHIRNPEKESAPDNIEDRRLEVYRELFFNNIEGFVSSAFPVLKSLYDESTWQALVRQFFVEHDCKSPYFLEISQEFLHYLQFEYERQANDPQFMLELAHYEWSELDVAVYQSSDDYVTIDDIEQQPLYFKDTARNLSYQYPVHQISKDFQPQQPSEQPCCFVIYRDEEEEVAFISSNAMTAMLLQVIAQNPGIVLRKLIELVHQQLPQFSFEQLYQGAQQTLSAFTQLGIIASKNSH
ncbi:putative DNA-binding domain-containing protein [Pseudoalteromonas sp. MMG022]|uniref:HvfC family RiPP maturation protein n=1 Tax=Pseudoalteromonas sp. MMG022 TaxID=2909978 RepID=UPI001F3502EB|nr:putative DNA-binding domain-containing protein [Pseudoalteromonas sp. MMG022]MCF6435114.1 putative DNA-binding domain-containing protein [Pseudoalteromonas sp. MMG022]